MPSQVTFNISAEPVTGTCDAQDNCALPAAAIVTSGCEHEHITVVNGCYQFVEEVRKWDGYWICMKCRDGSEPHSPCYVSISVKYGSLPEDEVSLK